MSTSKKYASGLKKALTQVPAVATAEAAPAATRARKPRKPVRRRMADAVPNFDTLANSAFVRQADLVRDPRHPEKPAVLPFGGTSLWREVAAGRFPKPVKFGGRITAWRVADVRRWLAEQQEASAA